MLAGAVRVDGQFTPCRAAPPLGADNAAVFGRIGVKAGEMADLKQRGVI